MERDQNRVLTLTGVCRKLIPILRKGFDGLRIEVEEVTVEICIRARELQLEVGPEARTAVLPPHGQT